MKSESRVQTYSCDRQTCQNDDFVSTHFLPIGVSARRLLGWHIRETSIGIFNNRTDGLPQKQGVVIDEFDLNILNRLQDNARIAHVTHRRIRIALKQVKDITARHTEFTEEKQSEKARGIP